MKNTNKMLMTTEQALLRASSLCGGREYCPYEIFEKLRRWGVMDVDAEQIVDRLIDEDFINEERYCRAFCSDKFRYNHWGRLRIRQELRLRHLPARLISVALSGINEVEYLQTLRHIIEQKNRSISDSDSYLRRGKLVRHALSKGFETELVLEILDSTSFSS